MDWSEEIADETKYLEQNFSEINMKIINMGQLLALFYVTKIFIYIK